MASLLQENFDLLVYAETQSTALRIARVLECSRIGDGDGVGCNPPNPDTVLLMAFPCPAALNAQDAKDVQTERRNAAQPWSGNVRQRVEEDIVYHTADHIGTNNNCHDGRKAGAGQRY
jgi:hypothetical protein